MSAVDRSILIAGGGVGCAASIFAARQGLRVCLTCGRKEAAL